jgi:radical SAM protein with 4Fe4S-binding SPASM domain
MLNWFYDRSLEGEIELKATCAPHYFRVVRQRRAAERRASGYGAHAAIPVVPSNGIGPADMLMPGGTGITIHASREVPTNGHSRMMHNGHPIPPGSGHPDGMNAMTKGCLAGTGVCFISHLGEVYPCGYLPVIAGKLSEKRLADIWANSEVFEQLRDANNLKGKCGCCEFKNVCMGCRARAFAASGDFMQEEPFCVYEPRSAKTEQTVH